jgi:hypothetical protein
MEPPLKTRKSKFSVSPAPVLMEHRESHLQCSRSGPLARRDYVTPARKTVRISSGENDAIRAAVRAPSADAVPALARDPPFTFDPK